MKDSIKSYIKNRDWPDLVTGAIIGAVIGLVLTSFASPALNPHVTRFYEDTGRYSPPTVSVEINETGEFHPVNSSVEDFDGLKWKDGYSVYRTQIQNTGENPIEQLELTWRAPGCIVYSNTEGSTAGGDFSLSNRGTYGIYSDTPLDIDQYQCTKVIEVINGELSPDESLAVEFVVKSDFDKCDVLIDLNPINRHLLRYTWEKNGVRFDEQRLLTPPQLEEDYQQVQNTTLIGTRESITISSGEHIHSFVVGVRGENLSHAAGKCVSSPE